LTSWQWQLGSAMEVIAEQGRIVAEYFDIGYTRWLGWSFRPQAATLPEATAEP